MRIPNAVAVLLLIGFGLVSAAVAEQPPVDEPIQTDLRDLKIGLQAATMTKEGYFDFACGSNGGPPHARLGGWSDYLRCPADSNGLHEVYVEFASAGQADADLYRETFGETLWIDKYSGTKVAGYPVILSVLFDDGGLLRGIRAVTDPRAGVGERSKAYLMRIRVMGNYGLDGWTCVDRQPSNGETGVGRVYLNKRCQKVYDNNRRIVVEAHFFRRAGETGADAQGQFEPGQFESMTRWEVWDLSVPVP